MGRKTGIWKRFSLTSFVMTMWVLLGPQIVQVFSLKLTRKPFWHILGIDSNILHRSGMYNTSSMMRFFAPLLVTTLTKSLQYWFDSYILPSAMLTFTLGPVHHFLAYFFIDAPQTCHEHPESTINSSHVVWMVLACSESASCPHSFVISSISHFLIYFSNGWRMRISSTSAACLELPHHLCPLPLCPPLSVPLRLWFRQ